MFTFVMLSVDELANDGIVGMFDASSRWHM